MKRGYRAPYGAADRRGGIGGFVADIPVDAEHVSEPRARPHRDGAAPISTVPALMLWGPRDPIFSDRYLDDLVDRLPHADVHRFEGAGHLIAEDVDYAGAVLTWLGDRFGARPRPARPTVTGAVDAPPSTSGVSAAPAARSPSRRAARQRRHRPRRDGTARWRRGPRDRQLARCSVERVDETRARPAPRRRASRATASRCSCRPAPT